ncbi:hypothetical protein HPB47_021330 [Ixodes persulcatus]|uniref:Uncharacterized protein n=1 Tax=Ixodes persulcatus TaxID=34615 RepID=A0AC60QFB1_IXOPE|nr:hypothetical protein HPB47_021330 [Ixodes persulcatus]
MKERNVIRLIKAFVISRNAYIVPFLDLTLTEKDAIDRIILTQDSPLRKAISDHGVETHPHMFGHQLPPNSAQNARLASKGVTRAATDYASASYIHPVHDAGRYMARVKALESTLQQGCDDSEVTYIDAASADRGRMTLAVTNRSGKILTADSIYTSNSAEAEEAAIVLALTLSTTNVIVSDSQMAIRQYMRGHIPDKALKIATCHLLINHSPMRHSQATRVLTVQPALLHTWLAHLVSTRPFPRGATTTSIFKRVLDHYRAERRAYPEAHSTLSKAESCILRQVQTETVLNPVQLRSRYPDAYDPSCRNCGEIATLHHIRWGCPELLLHSKNQDFIKQARQPVAWESFLRDPDPKTQKIQVQLSSDAAVNIASRPSTGGIASSALP